MIRLIRNARVFRENAWRRSDILIAGQRIEAIDDALNCEFPGMEVIDADGMRAIPGYIDQHVHVTGGGGEGSFITQVPPLRLSEPVCAGVALPLSRSGCSLICAAFQKAILQQTTPCLNTASAKILK